MHILTLYTYTIMYIYTHVYMYIYMSVWGVVEIVVNDAALTVRVPNKDHNLFDDPPHLMHYSGPLSSLNPEASRA